MKGKVQEEITKKLSKLNINIISLMTPVNYLEFCLKFLVTIDEKRCRIFAKFLLSFDLIMILFSLLTKSLFSFRGLLIAICIHIILIIVVIPWKRGLETKRLKRTKDMLKENELKFNKINVTVPKMDKKLEEFLNSK